MTSQQAQSVAQELGDILPNDEKLQAEIHRLNRKSFIQLEQVKMLHDWFYSGFKEGIIILTSAKYLKLSIINDRM
ncbi:MULTISPECIES: hypothetical protein [unclassified Anabaena]|jgi:hypothetical protein|uniref:hypothetical protein n=1 Tax=unclassified Anabaena TaxID=2619674 RepID=UPI0006AC7D22|nr:MULTISPECIES: hypothetical protein [unclassified Anabaena]ALB41020.1 hypothetical protein AA650_11550 [Anabaena sp. WA102]MCX5983114.1 hypothetical protein [Nostocales cyanobacterium LacPavin_0920_SED1_MAG_38_18]OBQ15842.1 MAG: hypothetical protein AN486_21505 [Anabaena sp. AL93]